MQEGSSHPDRFDGSLIAPRKPHGSERTRTPQGAILGNKDFSAPRVPIVSVAVAIEDDSHALRQVVFHEKTEKVRLVMLNARKPEAVAARQLGGQSRGQELRMKVAGDTIQGFDARQSSKVLDRFQQELVRLDSGSSLKVTVARWLTPNGTSISDGGLTPDIVIERTVEDRMNDVDPQLEEALLFLNE